VRALFSPASPQDQFAVQLATLLNEISPPKVLARLQAAMGVQAAPPPAGPAPIPEITHEDTNVGLFTQAQFVGKRVRAGELQDDGWVTGLGDINQGWFSPPAAASLAQQPKRVPTTIGLANQVATTPKGFEVAERHPATEAKYRFTLYAPRKTNIF